MGDIGNFTGINVSITPQNYLSGDIRYTVLKGEKGDSVDINVVEDTLHSYIVEFKTPDETITSPNLKPHVEDVSSEIFNHISSITDEEIESIFEED